MVFLNVPQVSYLEFGQLKQMVMVQDGGQPAKNTFNQSQVELLSTYRVSLLLGTFFLYIFVMQPYDLLVAVC